MDGPCTHGKGDGDFRLEPLGASVVDSSKEEKHGHGQEVCIHTQSEQYHQPQDVLVEHHPLNAEINAHNGRCQQNQVGNGIDDFCALGTCFFLACNDKGSHADAKGFRQNGEEHVRTQNRIYNIAPFLVPDLAGQQAQGVVINQIGGQPDQQNAPKLRPYHQHPKHGKQDGREDIDDSPQERPPVEQTGKVAQFGQEGQFSKEEPAASDGLDTATAPTLPLFQQIGKIIRGKAGGQNLVNGKTGISFGLDVNAGGKVLGNGLGADAPHFFQRTAGNKGIRTGIDGGVAAVSPYVDLFEEVVLLVGNIALRKEIKLEQIRVVKALGGLHETDFIIRVQLFLCPLSPNAVLQNHFRQEEVRNGFH